MNCDPLARHRLGCFCTHHSLGGRIRPPVLSRKRMDVERRTRWHSKDLDETLPKHFRKFKTEVTCQVKVRTNFKIGCFQVADRSDLKRKDAGTGGGGQGGSCPSNLKWGGALPLQLEPGDLPIFLNDWYSTYLPRGDISPQVVKRKEHGSLMHWLVVCFQIDLFYFTDLFVWFQMNYMSSSLFKDNLVQKVN